MTAQDLQLLTDCQDPEPMFASSEWACEEKLDGERRCVVKIGNEVRMFTRNGNEVALTETDMALAMLGGDYAIDGEFYKGAFVAFDLLDLSGSAMVGAGNGARRDLLVAACPFPLVRRAVGEAEKRALAARVKAESGEGVVFKRITARYEAGRHETMQRWKYYHVEPFRVRAVDLAKCSVEVEQGGISFGRCACTLDTLPHVGDTLLVKHDGYTRNGKLLRPRRAS